MNTDQNRADALMMALYDHATGPATPAVCNRIAATWRRIELHAQRKPDEERSWS